MFAVFVAMIRLRALNEESSEESEGEEEIPLITREAQVTVSLIYTVRLHALVGLLICMKC